jgi:hypothetical protein
MTPAPRAPGVGGPARRPLADRFWAKVDKNGPTVRPDLGPCWHWTGALQGSGTRYGSIGVGGGGKTGRASRVSWEIANGPIPKGMQVLHRCDNTRCVNVAHLFLGTHQDNMDDRSAKGRGRSVAGERHYRAKLTAAQVEEIRTAPSTQRAIGARFGISQRQVWSIKHGTSWASVPMTAADAQNDPDACRGCALERSLRAVGKTRPCPIHARSLADCATASPTETGDTSR